MKLVIFDLDQTLVDFIQVHDKAAQRLFSRCFGVDARLTEIDFAGKSLNDNFVELARLKNIPEHVFRTKRQELMKSYETTFNDSLPADAEKHVLPGATELLGELLNTDHITALYTGDSQGIVKAVFRVTGLGKYFKFSLYGTEVETRADMVRLAVDKANQMTGQEFKNKGIVIIGDSVRDIECGKLFNALTIAVATGFHSQAQLLAAGPDYLFADLRDYRRILAAIDGSEPR